MIRSVSFPAVAFLSVLLASACGYPQDRGGASLWSDHPVNIWVKQSPRQEAPAPGFSWEGSGAYDPRARQWVHHGGHDGVPQGFALFTWGLESGRWEQRFPNTSPPGVCCVDGANVFDTANRRFVRFPGACLGHGWQCSRGVHLKSSGVWLYDPVANEWSNMRPPPYKEPEKYSREVLGSLNAGGAYDPNHEVAISFGGQGSAGDMDNLYVYDAYANYLERLEAANSPGPRDGMGLCYDSGNDCLAVFGSQYADDERTWIYRYATNAWEAHDLSPHPPGKKFGTYATIPKMAYDSRNGVCLCVVWLDENGHETWALDVGEMQWTKLNPEVEPDRSASRSRNLSYVPDLNLFILETWSRESGAQIWTYRYRAAPQSLAPGPPTDLTVATGSDTATLTWHASPSPSVTSYDVYRARARKPWQADLQKIGSTDAMTYVDHNLEKREVYFYAVRAVTAEGRVSTEGSKARTQPRVVPEVAAAVLRADQVRVAWRASSELDLAGYNIYRGVVSVATNTAMAGSWGFNDPAYPAPVVDKALDIRGIEQLNEAPVTDTAFIDTQVDLTTKLPESADYGWGVYAYIVRAVNRLGTESGPSPYALTIPPEPEHVLVRETDGGAEVKWEPLSLPGITGYHVYRMGVKEIARLTSEPIQSIRFVCPDASRARYLVTAVDVLGQEGQPSSPAWCGQSYEGFYRGEWHQ